MSPPPPPAPEQVRGPQPPAPATTLSADEAVAELARGHRLDAAGQARLWALAALDAEPSSLARRLPQGLWIAAAALAGFGLVMGVASQWAGLGRVERSAVLQAVVLLAALTALPRLRGVVPAGLLAWIGIGALFAYVGQTYQTGADPWQLFALWALLGLPIGFAARSDWLWAPWSAVAMTAVATWVTTLTGHHWRVQPADMPVQALAFTLGLGIAFLLSPALSRRTGAGPWSHRFAFLLLVVWLGSLGVMGLMSDRVAPQTPLALLALALIAFAHARGRGFEVFVLSAAALAIDTLLVGLLAHLLFRAELEPVPALLLIALAAAGLLSASVSGVLALQRRTPAGAASAAAPEPR